MPPAPDSRAGAAARPIRVMHLLYALGVGGMELGVVKLVTGLNRKVVHSTICSCVPVDPRHTHWAGTGALFQLTRRNGNDPALVGRLYRLFRREKPDIVHTHAWGTLCEGVAAAALARVPFVVHGEHGTLEERPINLWVQRRVWSRVDRVLAVSSTLADRMSAATGFPRERITVIRNGVDLARFGTGRGAAARRALGLGASDFVAGTIGRCVPVKDQHTLLRAVAAVRTRGIPVKAVIVGDGPLRAELEAAASVLGIGEDVLFLGMREDTPDLLAAMDVFVLTSRSEGMSNTVLEAMASGLPVVATRVGGNPELVQDGETGVLVPPESPDAVAGALAALRDDPARLRRMGIAGRMRAETEFSLEGMMRRYENLYTALAGGAKPAASAFFPGARG